MSERIGLAPEIALTAGAPEGRDPQPRPDCHCQARADIVALVKNGDFVLAQKLALLLTERRFD